MSIELLIQFTDEQVKWMRKNKAQRGQPVAWFVREAVAEHIIKCARIDKEIAAEPAEAYQVQQLNSKPLPLLIAHTETAVEE